MAKLRPLTKKPLCAIGGITPSNVGDVLKAGGDPVAVISSIVPEQFNRNELKRRAEEWIAALGSPAVQPNGATHSCFSTRRARKTLSGHKS